MKKILFHLILILSLSLTMKFVSGQVLDVPETIQEHSMWCWDASSNCVLTYYGYTFTQCEIADWTWSRSDCCGEPTFYWDHTCNSGNFLFDASDHDIDDILDHYGNISSVGQNSVLTEEEIQTSISSGKPYVFRWDWDGGGAHALVGHGIIDNTVYYMDPWPGEGLSFGDYDWMVDGGSHTWTRSLSLTVVPNDFYVENAEVDKSCVGPGAQINVSCNQCYRGSQLNADLDDVELGYYLSEDTWFGPTDIFLGDDISDLGTDDPCDLETANLLIPNGTLAGTYYVVFIVDYHNYFPNEPSEANNFAFVQIQIDDVSPTINCPASAEIPSDEGECTYTIAGSEFDATATDNGTVETLSWVLTGATAGSGNNTMAGTVLNFGENTVTWTAIDECGNESECSFAITVNDLEKPDAVCQDISIYLDLDGKATIEVSDVDDGSDDNCGIDNMELSKTDFTCTDVGENEVTLTVTDIHGNSSSCTSTVTVIDNIPPEAFCKDADIYLEQNGSVTILPTDIDDGSSDNCSFNLSVDPNLIDCDDFGVEEESIEQEVTLTITDASGNTDDCTSTVTIRQRPTTLTYDGDFSAQYSDEVNLSATLVDYLTGDPIEGKEILFEIGAQSTTGTTNGLGVATGTIVMTQNPCDEEQWKVKTTFTGDCPYWNSSDEDDFTYLPEDALAEYTGVAIVATENVKSMDFTATLRGVVWEDDDEYGLPGDISNAMARFVVDGNPVITADTDGEGYIPVSWLTDGDHTEGVIETVWNGTLPKSPTTFDVVVELKGCYYDGESQEFPLTIYQAAGDFITGGGHMILTEDAAGAYAPTPGSKMNFGFNLKFNKTGRNLQGKMNIIYRVLDEFGEIEKVYQIKSNATLSLGTNFLDEETAIAEFVSKAELTDVTDPENPIVIAGNLTLHSTLTDKGEPGEYDMIGFSLYAVAPKAVDEVDPGALWFSSNWGGIKTVEQVIDGGNLVVHCGVILIGDEVVEVPKNKSAFISEDISNSFTVYPNPFTERTYFEFSREEDCMGTLEIFDLTGRKVAILFEQFVKANISYRVEFTPENIATNMIIYRMTFNNQVINGRLIYKK